MVTVTHEVAQKVKCLVCGAEKFALKAPYVCHGCWESGKAAQMIQRLTPRAADAPPCKHEHVTSNLNVSSQVVCLDCGETVRR